MLSNARPPPLVLMIYGADTAGYAAFFAASGFRLAEARDAADGLEQAIALVPDLIVLDFGYDGDTVARLRGNTTTSAIPIIALTDICRLGECGTRA
jgi:DNA-binding response OmpR family regulator